MPSNRSAGQSGRPAATSVTAPTSRSGSAPSMVRSAPISPTRAMNSRRSSYCTLLIERRQLERAVDHRAGALEIVVAEHVHLHEEGGAAVELLVLLVAVAELRADEVPREPHERDALPGANRRGLKIALDVARRFRVFEVCGRRR